MHLIESNLIILEKLVILFSGLIVLLGVYTYVLIKFVNIITCKWKGIFISMWIILFLLLFSLFYNWVGIEKH